MRTRNSGFSLIEILISLFILSLLLLGFDAMELTSMRDSKTSYFFNVASIQMLAMTERLYALDQSQGLEEQVAIWNKQNHALLPHARGIVSGQYPFYQISLAWGGNASCEISHQRQLQCLVEQVHL
jgi:prepilin-type N-terminal cleavage/methylation domain-containing protein